MKQHSHLFRVSFIPRERRARFLPDYGEFQFLEVPHACRFRLTEHFQIFLLYCIGTIRQVMDGADGTVHKGDRDKDVVIVISAGAVGGSDRVNADGKRAAKELHHVDEVAAFAYKASPLLRMLHPVNGWTLYRR